MSRPANNDMIDGYMDGYDPYCPQPSSNRSQSYVHGWLNARDDLRGSPRDTAANLRQMAEEAMDDDAARMAGGPNLG